MTDHEIDKVTAQRIRGGLALLAGPPPSPETTRRAVQRAHVAARRRSGAATAWLAAAAVVAVVAGAGAVALLIPGGARLAAPSVSTGGGSITSWPARGNLVTDESLITRATQVWRTEAPADRQPGPDVSTLYAGSLTGTPTAVVMLASRTAGAIVVGMVSTAQNLSGPQQPTTPLMLRAVATVDPTATIRSVGFVTAAAPADHPGSLFGALGYVLLAPGITTGAVQSSMYDSFMTDHAGLPPALDGVLTFQGLAGSGPWNSWVATPPGTPGTDVLAAGLRDPGYTAGLVDSSGVVTSGDGTPLRAGDLVVARDERAAGNGLLGVVSAVTGRTGTVDASLTDLSHWGLQAISFGSNYPGTLTRDAGGGLVFTTDAPNAPNGVSRVVVRTADGSVTVNVGGFAPAQQGTSNTAPPFPLQQTDTLPASGTIPVWIVATGR